MANVKIYDEINFSLEDEEFEILNKAWNILFGIADELFQNDKFGTQLFEDAYEGQFYIKQVVKLANRKVIREK